MTITGGCLCGALRYTIDVEPKGLGKCYCVDCQKETGTGHMTFVSVPTEAITLTGPQAHYSRPGGSGTDVERVFCPTCGTTVVGYPAALGPIGAVRAGTLDDTAGLALKFAVYTARAQEWDVPPGGIKSFETMPPR